MTLPLKSVGHDRTGKSPAAVTFVIGKWFGKDPAPPDKARVGLRPVTVRVK